MPEESCVIRHDSVMLWPSGSGGLKWVVLRYHLDFLSCVLCSFFLTHRFLHLLLISVRRLDTIQKPAMQKEIWKGAQRWFAVVCKKYILGFGQLRTLSYLKRFMRSWVYLPVISLLELFAKQNSELQKYSSLYKIWCLWLLRVQSIIKHMLCSEERWSRLDSLSSHPIEKLNKHPRTWRRAWRMPFSSASIRAAFLNSNTFKDLFHIQSIWSPSQQKIICCHLFDKRNGKDSLLLFDGFHIWREPIRVHIIRLRQKIPFRPGRSRLLECFPYTLVMRNSLPSTRIFCQKERVILNSKGAWVSSKNKSFLWF